MKLRIYKTNSVINWTITWRRINNTLRAGKKRSFNNNNNNNSNDNNQLDNFLHGLIVKKSRSRSKYVYLKKNIFLRISRKSLRISKINCHIPASPLPPGIVTGIIVIDGISVGI